MRGSRNRDIMMFDGTPVYDQFADAIRYDIQGKPTMALKCIKNHIMRYPDDILAYYMQADILHTKGRYEDALESINHVWNSRTATLSMIIQKADVHAYLCDRRGVLETMALVKKFKDNLDSVYYKSSLVFFRLAEAGDASAYADAAKYISKACRLDKENKHYHSTAAAMFIEWYQSDDVTADTKVSKIAYKHARLAIKYGHETKFEHDVMGTVLFNLGKYTASLKHYQWMLRKYPNDPYAMLMVGCCMSYQDSMSNRHYEKALRYLDLAIANDASDLDAHNAKINALIWIGDIWRIKQAISELIKVAPNDAENLLCLGCAETLTWRMQTGVGLIKKAIKLNPNLGMPERIIVK